MSERRACKMITADRSTVRYRARRPDDAGLRARLRELADQRRRFGYRRLYVLPRGEGWTMNRKKTRAGSMARRAWRCVGANPGAGSQWRAPRSPRPTGPTAAGRPTLAMGLGPVAAPWLDPRPAGHRSALPGADHHRRRHQGMLGRHPGHLAVGKAGRPGNARVDRPARQAGYDRQRQRRRVHLRGGPGLHSGSEARLALHRAGQADPGHACAESFQGRMRDESLNEALFFSLGHVRAVVAGWVHDFNTARPHSTIGYMTPAAYAATLKPQRAPALRQPGSFAPTPVAAVALSRNSQQGIPAARGGKARGHVSGRELAPVSTGHLA